MKNDTRTEPSTTETAVRKVYARPELQIYGDLATVTRQVSGSKHSDGDGHPNKHFTS